MNIFLFFVCIPILFLLPILYPPIASFTAIFFVKKELDSIALFLVISAAIVSSLISATIIPVGDTQVYIDSFKDIQLFDFTQLKLNNNGFEPFYKIYEYLLSIFLEDNQKFFLLTTALIFNLLSTIAILRICLRFNQTKLAFIIFAVYYSLVAPALGVPLFLLRSSLSLSILFLGISYYNQKNVIFYLLAIIAILIHSGSILIFGAIIFQRVLHSLSEKIEKIGYGKITSLSKILGLRFSLLLLFIGFLLVALTPNLLISVLQNFLTSFGESGGLASSKSKSFLDTNKENFVDFTNPVFLLQVALSLLCFLKLQDDLLIRPNISNTSNQKLSNLLESLRVVGRLQIIMIVLTGPFNFLPYRLGFFNFLYFPFWLINVPYLSFVEIKLGLKKYSKYLIIFALISVLTYTFYWMPKRQNNNYYIVVLEGKPLSYNLPQVIEKFLY
ncbi:EpsG family protein [Nostoc sp. CENA67]|uniref:EpsG family protein n=1 Tax=Amazonocrinis nigriterrae CENA67 TaxID=2794033 RepID=A0A8J7L7Q8_9NOST|nr:EpsG family protein [Amazonocrinis nigriterrae]MBH8563674.1 EpsG family protein [Amazonocrinis nigriterrae CENA67]